MTWNYLLRGVGRFLWRAVTSVIGAILTLLDELRLGAWQSIRRFVRKRAAIIIPSVFILGLWWAGERIPNALLTQILELGIIIIALCVIIKYMRGGKKKKRK